MVPFKCFLFWLGSASCYKFSILLGTQLYPEDLETPDWWVNVSKNASDYVDLYTETAIIPGTDVCRPETEIVIVVVTPWHDFESRMLIRETWGRDQRPKVRVGFIFGVVQDNGAQLIFNEESTQFGDIIQENFTDNVFNRTVKHLYMLKWFIQMCPIAKYLMKVDGDTFVNVLLLADKLSRAPKTGVLAGKLCPRCRDNPHRWYAPENRYPDFLQGGAYYMSSDVAVKLFQAALTTPLHHLDDVYITGLCSQAAGIELTPDRGVRYLGEHRLSFCFVGYFLTCNGVKADKMEWMYETLKNL